MNKAEEAVACFNEGFCCSQAVLSTHAPMFDLDRNTALKIATSFCGGMGHMGETCGAVTGALMVIGLKHGRTEAEDEETKERAYDLVREFVKEFESRNGSTRCRDLLGIDIGTPEGLNLIREKNLFDTLCTKLVRDAVEIIEKIL